MKTDIIECENVKCVICGNSYSVVTGAGYDYEYKTTDQYFKFVECSGCGHEYLNPRPLKDNIGKAYPQNYYTLEGRHTGEKARIVALFKKFIVAGRLRSITDDLKKRSAVFEVGCGDCSLLVDLKQKNPEYKVSGIDLVFSDAAVKQSKELGIDLKKGNIEDLDLGENVFDLIILNQLIEHVIDPCALLSKLSGALKKGGRISIETPDKDGFDRKFFHKSFWGGYYFPRHLHLFGFEDIERLIVDNDLQVEKHYSLVAPIIWAFSFHAALSHGALTGKQKKVYDWFFSDKNPICLGVFTIIDLCAKFAGLQTSNQKIIARKK